MERQEKIILGIDPGTRLMGHSVIKSDGQHFECLEMGVLDLRKEADPLRRLELILEEVLHIIDAFHPQYLSIESPFYGKNVQVMLKLGRAQGMAIAAALSRGIPIFEYAPRKAKMAITGVGAASKEQVSLILQKTLQVDFEERFLDASDALAIAMCHFYQLTNPLSSVTASTDWKSFIESNPERVR